MNDSVVLQEAIIRTLFETKINLMLSTHGGSASLIKIEEDKAYIEFSGGCQGCAGARVTLGRYLSNAIKQVIPSIVEVIDVTNHDAGLNPYYKKEDIDE